MAQFRYTMDGDYDPENFTIGYQEPINPEARTLDFGPGNVVDGYEEFEDSLVYFLDGPGIEYEFQVFQLSTQMAGLYGDSSDFDKITRVTGGDFGDVFRTGDGNDVLNGAGGNDILEGGRGINTIDGGTGTNTLSYEHFDAPTEDGSGGVGVDMRTGEGYDYGSDKQQDFFVNIANIRGSQYNDGIDGNTENNVIEGGAGADYMTGGGGVDTLSYAHSTEGVTVDLSGQDGLKGDAEGDHYLGFLNVLGSTSNDVLSGTGDANTLNGNGGNDELYGRGGDDRLVIGNSPVKVQGDQGTDLLFIARFGNVELTDESFASIERVYVRDGASLTMAGVDIGTKIYSQSLNDGSSKIVGTDGADRIVAGKGGDVITGGKGGDSLFGGAGANIFEFASGDGRDVIRKFDVTEDALHIGLITQSMDDVKIGSFHGEANTIITFTSDTGASNKIILLDVTVDSVTEGSFLF
ncbi:calcium-binding protein [Methylobacterium sp. Leaf106]|uniref:calcium-binding protein n=1 Tax=Methylobacterium sp. Leaf106 TaxID=1736255 RepID=UPI000A71C768|nr:calcium-binding protein [Methylobacterium sp. Leaf106]